MVTMGRYEMRSTSLTNDDLQLMQVFLNAIYLNTFIAGPDPDYVTSFNVATMGFR